VVKASTFDQESDRNPYESVRAVGHHRRFRSSGKLALEQLLDDPVTLTGHGFETSAVENQQALVAVLDPSAR
jgi:hypothetical protein